MLNTHILVKGFGRKRGEMASSKKGLRCMSLKNSSPDSKADVGKKIYVFCTWRLILVRYDLVSVRYDIILNIQEIKTHILNRY